MTEFEVVKARLVFMLERVVEPQLSVYYTPPPPVEPSHELPVLDHEAQYL